MRRSWAKGIAVLLLLAAPGCAGFQQRVSRTSPTMSDPDRQVRTGWWRPGPWNRQGAVAPAETVANRPVSRPEARAIAPEEEIWPGATPPRDSRFSPLLGKRGGNGGEGGPTASADTAAGSRTDRTSMRRPIRGDDSQVRPAAGDRLDTEPPSLGVMPTVVRPSPGTPPGREDSPIARRAPQAETSAIHDRPQPRGEVALEIGPTTPVIDASREAPASPAPSVAALTSTEPEARPSDRAAAPASRDSAPAASGHPDDYMASPMEVSAALLAMADLSPPAAAPPTGDRDALPVQGTAQPPGAPPVDIPPPPATRRRVESTPSRIEVGQPSVEPAAPAELPGMPPQRRPESAPSAAPAPAPSPTAAATPPPPALVPPTQVSSSALARTAVQPTGLGYSMTQSSGPEYPSFQGYGRPSAQAPIFASAQAPRPATSRKKCFLLTWLHSLHSEPDEGVWSSPQLPTPMFPPTYKTCMHEKSVTNAPGGHLLPSAQSSPQAPVIPSAQGPEPKCKAGFHHNKGIMASLADKIRNCDKIERFRAWKRSLACTCTTHQAPPPPPRCGCCGTPTAAPQALPWGSLQRVTERPRVESQVQLAGYDASEVAQGGQVLERIAAKGLDKTP